MVNRRQMIESIHAEATAWRQDLHQHPQPQYDFNDGILPLAAEYFAELAERRLPVD